MKQPLSIALVAFASIVLRSEAATVVTANWAAAFDNGLALQNGTALAVGNEVRLGTFDFPDVSLNTDIQAFLTAGNLSGLSSHFRLFSTAFIGTDAFAGNLGQLPLNERQGLFEKTTGGVLVPTSDALFGKQFFMWAFKTTADGVVAGNFSNVQQVGIFSSNTPAWLAPSDSGLPESRSFDLTNLSNTPGTAFSGTQRIPWGSFGAGTTPATMVPAFNLAPVTIPEPTSFGLALVGMAAITLRRRRK